MSSPFRRKWCGGTYKIDLGYNQTLQDIFTIANNLGFPVGLCDLPKNYGEKCTVLMKNSDKVFMTYRVYKNDNMHVKFNIEFMKALNVECSRLLGWIRKPEDIKREFSDEMAKGAEKYFKKTFTCLNLNSVPLLTTSKKPRFNFDRDTATVTMEEDWQTCLKSVLKTIDKVNGNNTVNDEMFKKCTECMTEANGFVYKNCLITNDADYVKIVFRELEDLDRFIETLSKAA